MKRIWFIVFIFLIFSLSFATNFEDLQKKWDYENPFSLPHWLTPDEMQRIDEIGRDFYETEPPPAPVKNVAEFDKMQAVLIRYPFGIPMSLIAEMSQDIEVTTLVSSTSQQNSVLNQYSNNGVNTDNCDFIIAYTDTYWTRDFGPWFIFDGNDEPGIVNFPYNRPRPHDDDIPIAVANYLNINLYGMNVIHTGGNYMTDGMGYSASSTLVWQENPSLSHTEINQRVHDYLGIENYYVIPDPNNTYIDHIDCWGKYLSPGKVLIRSVPTGHPQYDEIEATADYFATHNSAYGIPYEVFRVYTPGDEPYTNSLILNNKVFVPQTGSAWDDEALTSYEEAMPGYEIHGIYDNNWMSTDALHCRTKGIADLGMLYVNHIPILGNQPSGIDYDIIAKIKPYSGETVYSDSLWVYYKINGGNYNAIQMNSAGDDNYEAIIPAQSEGTEIAYYIHAADHSGRSANCPFIGAPDPFVFYAGTPIPPELSVQPSEFSLTMSPNSTSSDILELSNIGGGLLEYSISLENQPVRDLTGSHLTCSASEFVPGETATWTFTVYNGSNDNEWLRDVSIDFPEGIIVNSSTNFVGGTGGELVSDGSTGNGIQLQWIDDNGNYGNIYPDESANAEVSVTVEANFSGDVTLNYTITGDEYGDEPHQISGTIIIAGNGEPISWISLNPTSGTIPGGESDNIDVNFNTADLVSGTYNCNIVISDNRTETIVPVTLTVSDAEAAEEQIEPMLIFEKAVPNPFRTSTTISFEFSTEQNEQRTISIYNIKGEKIRSLECNNYVNAKATESLSITWDGRDENGKLVSPGVYLYKLQTEKYSAVKKIMFIKK